MNDPLQKPRGSGRCCTVCFARHKHPALAPRIALLFFSALSGGAVLLLIGRRLESTSSGISLMQSGHEWTRILFTADYWLITESCSTEPSAPKWPKMPSRICRFDFIFRWVVHSLSPTTTEFAKLQYVSGDNGSGSFFSRFLKLSHGFSNFLA